MILGGVGRELSPFCPLLLVSLPFTSNYSEGTVIILPVPWGSGLPNILVFTLTLG